MNKFAIPEKICKHCKKSKIVHEFYLSSKTHDGSNPCCKQCIKENKKQSELDKIRDKTRKTTGIPDRSWFGKI